MEPTQELIDKTRDSLILEIGNIEEELAILRDRIAADNIFGADFTLDVGQLNFLLGQYTLLATMKAWQKMPEKNAAPEQPRQIMTVPELIADHNKWEATQRKAAQKIGVFCDELGKAIENVTTAASEPKAARDVTYD
jgi:hypothetical protein